MTKINEAVSMKNLLENYGGKKWLDCSFRRQELWKCIGCILSVVTYEKKGHNLWSETTKTFGEKPQTKSKRDIFEKTYFIWVCFISVVLITAMLAIESFYITPLYSFIGCFL